VGDQGLGAGVTEILEPADTPEDGPKQEFLFAITSADGKRTEYTQPAEYPPAWGLKYAHVSRTQGINFAIDWLLCKALSTEARLALYGADSMTNEQMGDIIGAVCDKALGRAPAPKSGS
jgi:hypothetical protein